MTHTTGEHRVVPGTLLMTGDGEWLLVIAVRAGRHGTFLSSRRHSGIRISEGAIDATVYDGWRGWARVLSP